MSNKGMTANTTPGNCRLWLDPSSKAELSPMVGMGVHVFVSYPNQLHPILHSKGIGIGDEPTNLRNMLLLVCNLNCGHYSMLHVFCHVLHDVPKSPKKLHRSRPVRRDVSGQFAQFSDLAAGS